MKTASRKCPDCGGRVPAGRPEECPYCGASLVGDAQRPGAPAGERTADERIAAVERSPEYRQSLLHAPSAAGAYAGSIGGAVFGLIFAGVALFIFWVGTRVTGAFGGLYQLFLLFPLLFVGIGIAIVVGSLRRTASLSSAPLLRLAALVADERTEVSGGGSD